MLSFTIFKVTGEINLSFSFIVPCESDEFLCESGYGCLSKELVCDSIPQCLHRSDENGCSKLHFFPKFIFIVLYKYAIIFYNF